MDVKTPLPPGWYASPNFQLLEYTGTLQRSDHHRCLGSVTQLAAHLFHGSTLKAERSFTDVYDALEWVEKWAKYDADPETLGEDMTQPLSFFQQRAAQKKAEREQEYGLTPERIEVLKQLYTILNEEVLPVLAPLEREVCEELGFHLSWNWNAGSTGTLSSTAEDRWDPVPLKPQGVSYEKQVPQVNPGWTGGLASLARLREQLAWLRKTVHGDEDGVPSEIDCI